MREEDRFPQVVGCAVRTMDGSRASGRVELASSVENRAIWSEIVRDGDNKPSRPEQPRTGGRGLKGECTRSQGKKRKMTLQL